MPRQRSAPARAYVLPLVLVMTSVLAIAAVTLFMSLSGSASVSRRLVQRKTAFHATDGMMRATLKEANSFLRTNATTNPATATAQLQAHFTDAVLAPLVPAGFVVEKFDITTEGLQNGVVPNGAFAGMNARLFPVTSTLKLRRPSGDNAAAEVTTNAVLAQIAAFQFFLFGEGYVDWFPAPTSAVRGRNHVNGDLCLGGNQNFALERVTSSGGIFHINDDANCRHVESNRTNLKIAVAGACPDFPTTADLDPIAPTPTAFSGPGFNCLLRELPKNQDHGTAGWAAFAQSTFLGNVLDRDHGISSLKLPVTGSPLVQAGFSAAVRTATSVAAARASNFDNLRMLVDPLLPEARNEPPDVIKQKMMFKADLRIINGVWYLRDPAHPELIGTPIWSDHPGSMTWSPDGEFATGGPSAEDTRIRGTPSAVGQVDLDSARSWGAVKPRLYSYYETQISNAKIQDNDDGIISYGTLVRKNAQLWVPGFRSVDTANGERWCRRGVNPSTINTATQLIMRDATGDLCGGADPVMHPGANLLHATRSGIKDGHAVSHVLEPSSPTTPSVSGAAPPASANLVRERRAKLLPINFDVAAFQAALQDTTVLGELGDVFLKRGTPFNGIVYLTSTWTNANSGYTVAGTTNAAEWPTQGNQGGNEPAPTLELRQQFSFGGSPAANDTFDSQRALPWPLCSTGSAGDAFDDDGRFVVPSCTDATTRDTRPNVLRIINAAHINPPGDVTIGAVTVRSAPRPLPVGLSIVTNLPVMVVGDLNIDSDPSTSSALPWTPVMIGGDALYHLSSNWDDRNAPWAGILPEFDRANMTRIAADTTWNAAWITGWTVTSAQDIHSGGIQNITRYLEDWGGGAVTQNLNGAFLVGYASVHNRTTVAFKQTSFGAPDRNWAFDPHLESLDNQPPGAPEFNISSTRAWSRR